MHSFARRLHSQPGKTSATGTKGLILKGGWRYDLGAWFCDTFLFRGQWRQLRQKTTTLAQLQPGDAVLDVGCGTGTLALEVARRVGRAGRVVGVDPGTEQIARARAKAARRNAPIEFQIGVIEQLPFPDHSFDVVLSTLMMHHLPASLKRQGLAEIARVLKPGGRLVIADFTHKKERSRQAAQFHAGGSRLHDLAALVLEAGFDQVETEEMRPPRFSAFPGAGFVCASNGSNDQASKEQGGDRSMSKSFSRRARQQDTPRADSISHPDSTRSQPWHSRWQNKHAFPAMDSALQDHADQQTSFDHFLEAVKRQIRPEGRALHQVGMYQHLRTLLPPDMTLADLVAGWQVLAKSRHDTNSAIRSRRKTCAELAAIAAPFTGGQGNLTGAVKIWQAWLDASQRSADPRFVAMRETFARELVELQSE